MYQKQDQIHGINVTDYMELLFLDITSETALGEEIFAQETGFDLNGVCTNKIVNALHNWTYCFSKRGGNMLMWSDFLFKKLFI